MAFNNDFYFSGISLQPNQQMPLALQSALERDFGSIDSLKEEMLAMADAMFGPGFVWPVRVNTTYGIGDRKFMLLPTYLAGSPLAGAHNRRQPIDMNTQNVANAQAHGGVEGLSKAQFSEQHMTPQNSVGSFGQYARKDANAPAYGGVNVLPCLCVNTWEHAYMYDWKFNKRMFLERWWMFINWQRVATLSDVEGDARRRQQRGFKGVGSSWRPSY
jgi:Fe-Mn family superoxide dismutase